MSSYIKSELYRMIHSKKPFLFVAICSGLLIASNIVLAVLKGVEPSFPYATTQFSVGNFMSSLTFVFILCITVASQVFGNEHSNHTFKNTISFGISRGTVYFGKWIVSVIYAIVAFFIITGIHVASAYLLLENSNVNEVAELLKIFLAAFPLFLFALTVANCFAFLFEGSGAAIGADVGLLVAVPIVSNFLGMKFEIFRKINEIIPMNIINNFGAQNHPFGIVLPWEGNAGYYNCWLAGILQMLVMLIVGYLIFRKKEIK